LEEVPEAVTTQSSYEFRNLGQAIRIKHENMEQHQGPQDDSDVNLGQIPIA